jgi:hypothetical protein
MSGYNQIPRTIEIGARQIRKGQVLFLGGAGTRIVASDPYFRCGYIAFDTTFLDGQYVGRWNVRADTTVLQEIVD